MHDYCISGTNLTHELVCDNHIIIPDSETKLNLTALPNGNYSLVLLNNVTDDDFATESNCVKVSQPLIQQTTSHI